MHFFVMIMIMTMLKLIDLIFHHHAWLSMKKKWNWNECLILGKNSKNWTYNNCHKKNRIIILCYWSKWISIFFSWKGCMERRQKLKVLFWWKSISIIGMKSRQTDQGLWSDTHTLDFVVLYLKFFIHLFIDFDWENHIHHSFIILFLSLVWSFNAIAGKNIIILLYESIYDEQ